MKSVGEVMALGRTFPEALNKAVQSLEIGVDALDGSGPKRAAPDGIPDLAALATPSADRLFSVYRALRGGVDIADVSRASGYDLWFLAQMQQIVAMEAAILRAAEGVLEGEAFSILLRDAKRLGFADTHLARLLNAADDN